MKKVEPLITGIDVTWPDPCRCGCPRTRIAHHSTKSTILIWRCPWCKVRRDKPSQEVIELLEAFVRRHGWTAQPLIFHEDGNTYAIV